MVALPHPLHVQPALQGPASCPTVGGNHGEDGLYQQPSPEEVHAQRTVGMVGMLDERFLQATELLAAVGPDILAFTAFSVAHSRQVW